MPEETPAQEKGNCGDQCPNHPGHRTVSEGNIRLLSETIRDNAATLWMVTRAPYIVEGSSSKASTEGGLLGENTALLLETLKATSEAVSNITGAAGNNTIKTASIGTENEWLSVEARTMANLMKYPETEDVRIPLIRPGIGRVTGPRAFALSQRVGTISLEVWEGMSEKRLKELDIVLRRIVQRICDHGIGWDPTGTIIQEELARFGFCFATASNFAGDPGMDRAMDKATSDLARIQALSDHCRAFQGKDWYTDEMIRVVQRLMELRGFEI